MRQAVAVLLASGQVNVSGLPPAADTRRRPPVLLANTIVSSDSS
jgi:hypothetical protein